MNLHTILRRDGADSDHLTEARARSRGLAEKEMPGADRVRRLLLGRFTPAALVGIISMLIAGGGYALASGSSSIALCVKKNGGTVYKATKCHKHDSKLTFSKTGTPGPSGTAGQAGALGATGATGATGPTGPTGLVTIGSWSGGVDTIPAKSQAFVFAGPTTTLKTTATQTITASGVAALGTSEQLGTAGPAPSEEFNLSICSQPSAGGPVTVLDGNDDDDFEDVIATTTRIPYSISMSGAPGAGSWNIGVCVDNLNQTDLDNNDYSIGTAFVSNATFIPPPPPAEEGQALAHRR